ncbi:hypothetical protein PHYBLDRAFT_151317 [Phycomyces blakesleeanus NRRL 1555(-)]|uniref:Uncharacterized protein n=1 Tax=Phycomyces blakesleeanus (strain ATCC 8743b / DSM 1359 / FGSC 10004 / NBRC 33097 / NRRL 1555) TaxID=763407 RepID=A0A167K7E0_PHYB8|nr:hypothetical protein PHYBLDRAFT_151317 [Phycomyces blakesleeanus NRRL 1555(-)]OAD67417.1 hypothetical protein PHYBLDRAFT_151317 [Phycomyces blakesleeanus NRRL 1555(-)]|eukprot:XP_018285457.1 hypothetical protein PHYBLDRAFT_151317 [Phycomyces blakesleeanus NRRL 1555(-)]
MAKNPIPKTAPNHDGTLIKFVCLDSVSLVKLVGQLPNDPDSSIIANYHDKNGGVQANAHDELTTTHTAILVGFGQGTGSQTSVSVPLGGSLVAAGSTDRIPAGITSEISRENKAKVFKLIRGYMRKEKFTSTEPVLVSANEANPRSLSKKIVANFLGYPIPKLAREGIKTGEFRTMVHTNFRSIILKYREDLIARAAANARGRRAARETEHFNRRVMACVSNKTAIDVLMEKNCSELMMESASSEGESDDEFPGRPCKRIFNNLNFIIDEIVRTNLGSNICQLLDRNLTRLSEKPVPDDVALCFPPWTLRDGPQ